MSLKKKNTRQVRRNQSKLEENIKKTNFYLYRKKIAEILLYLEMILMITAFVAAVLFDYYYFYVAIVILLVLIFIIYPEKIEFQQNKKGTSSGSTNSALIGEE